MWFKHIMAGRRLYRWLKSARADGQIMTSEVVTLVNSLAMIYEIELEVIAAPDDAARPLRDVAVR